MPYKDINKQKERQKILYQIRYATNKMEHNIKQQERKKLLRDIYIRFKKQLKCSFCGKGNCEIQFHHIDPTNKFKNISVMIKNGNAIKTIINEIKKCIPLCGICHAKEGHRIGQIPNPPKRCQHDSNMRVISHNRLATDLL